MLKSNAGPEKETFEVRLNQKKKKKLTHIKKNFHSYDVISSSHSQRLLFCLTLSQGR